jgi:hypothetical protein
MSHPGSRRWSALAAATVLTLAGARISAAQATAPQKQDAEYTAKIKEYLTDPRITTELVDHLPASTKVPTPLKFFGRIVGTPGELTRSEDINRYMKAVAEAAPTRAKYWVMGKSEEGREMSAIVIGNEETIQKLNTYKGYLAELTDPRKTSEARARQLIRTAKPIYYITSGMHSPETGGPEMLMELAYRLVVEETPFIQDIRNNVITMITPVVETDGRDKIVDACYMQADLGYSPGQPYWGKYVQHDDNRDGMGQFLDLTKNIEKLGLEWHPTILHDLHEAQTLLYASTGTGPYNEQLDPITIDEWWMMAENDVMEMTKRGVPGVWTYGFYDGWVPNYMFYVVHAHNAVGRFYEVQSYNTTGCIGAPGSARATRTAHVRDSIAAVVAAAPPVDAGGGRGGRGGRGGGGGGGGRGGRGGYTTPVPADSVTHELGGSNYAQSREWFRPNPTPDDIRWGQRANTNIQESAILFALKNTAHEKERFLENYWIKNKNAVNKAKYGPIKAWVIPADQHSKANAAEAVNELIDQGLEFNVANTDFMAGNVQVHKGDYIVRGDQPFRTVADIYFSIQNYPTTNPSPYDDTGWTYQMMRNMLIDEIGDSTILKQPMTMVKGHVTAAGGIIGAAPASGGSTVIVDHTGDNNLMEFRFRFAGTPMRAAESDFDAAGHHFDAGSFIIANANRAQLEPALKELGLSGYVADVPASVKTHDLDVPRIGYIHSWTRTQDEGWVRAALDYYHVPYTYFGENAVRKMGRLRDKFDVILWPTGGAVGQGAPTGGQPIPYKSTKAYPSLGYPDSTDDVRGGLGEDGLKMLYDFAQEGGTIITEGQTSSIFTDSTRKNGDAPMTPGVKNVRAPGLVDRGTILRNIVADMTSPIVYGLKVNQMPVYFSGGAVLDVGMPYTPDLPAQGKVQATRPGARGNGGRGGFGGGGGFPGAGGRGGAAPVSVYQNTQPMATWVPHAIWEPMAQWPTPPGITAPVPNGPRVVMTFPASPQDMLLSGVLQGGENLSNRASVVDEPVGQGHIVMFTIRPFWRWQSQGTYILGFNTIMNWNDLNAGK